MRYTAPVWRSIEFLIRILQMPNNTTYHYVFLDLVFNNVGDFCFIFGFWVLGFFNLSNWKDGQSPAASRIRPQQPLHQGGMGCMSIFRFHCANWYFEANCLMWVRYHQGKHVSCSRNQFLTVTWRQNMFSDQCFNHLLYFTHACKFSAGECCTL